ncbi:pyridoxamine 5'-phosphate oxidase, FMN-binding family [Afipia felis]|jgi:predicted pyridoxine 5'-phosphate oxidase superfamily flavin-nucleotide-binding protein|uniref:Pyridoxamine 5'-phosphate oxidase, FMN-binding family n=1 Tax=Afipia felis TaxID=1035 RepID=A0A090N7B2_AFIFE|nr:pyridoxamine 5'-phosphate oxidase family protein [Afipia felis]CEG08298.1 pyridoxamine 5'-phosphate oxidase, FMN-binding family [Afipia felis]
MIHRFLEIATTPSVKAAQAANGVAEYWEHLTSTRTRDRFTEAELAFIAERDSFYIATSSENGWPYIQHRGGPKGFLRVLDDKTLAFADYRGNRQYITTGNLAANDRVCLFLMDYPRRGRLKVYARAEVKEVRDDASLVDRFAIPGYKAKVERVMILHLEAFDWNCSQHITPRFTEEELAEALEPVRAHLAELEAENMRLREMVGKEKALI